MLGTWILAAAVIMTPRVTGRLATDVTFSDESAREIAVAATKVLESCRYSASSTEDDFVQAKRGCHIDVLFAKPLLVTVNRKEAVTVRELVVVFPLASGGFLIRTSTGYRYFSKFTDSGQELQRLLAHATPR
ncbi:MAG TPA: hypothetical protein VER58_05345 [Thermoanaerobaculia bacterium]|nr:hypothetical protein [Thermoanaerobaculia bacterium]